MSPEQRRAIVLRPLATWAALLGLLALTFAYARWPHAPAKLAAALLIAGAMAALVVLLLMRLGRAAGIVRLAAVAGLMWGSFLYLFTFADVLTR